MTIVHFFADLYLKHFKMDGNAKRYNTGSSPRYGQFASDENTPWYTLEKVLPPSEVIHWSRVEWNYNFPEYSVLWLWNTTVF